MFLSSTKHLPRELTSYDLLKSFAVITMIIDHVGLYLFPEQSEWRLIGRMSMPVWLFLVGYAQTRDIPNMLWIGGVILILSDVLIGDTVFSLNILFTILLVRLTLDSVIEGFLKDRESMAFVGLSIVLLVLPTSFLFDYGSHAFLFAMFGFFVRHQKRLELSNAFILSFMGFAVVVHSGWQQLVFGFNEIESYFNMAGIFFICLGMTGFSSQVYPTLSTPLLSYLLMPLKIMGRHSLEVYVVHLLILKALAFMLFPQRFDVLQWSFF